MPRLRILVCLALVIVWIGVACVLHATGGGYTLVGWNNLGMHCMDSDYSVFSILPPYNTVYAQLMDRNGRLVRNPAGISVTFEAVADPDGSFNSTSVGKTNFWQFVTALFGATPAADIGLTGIAMPGAGNRPVPTTFDSSSAAFIAEGIPITPYDDSGNKNYYPLLHLVARDSSGTLLAATDVVTPVSDEMDCRACHASDSGDAARPVAGWVRDINPERDYRLNILRLHDDFNSGNPAYLAALGKMGYESSGLFATVTAKGRPVLCAGCHASNALPGTGVAGIPPLTSAVHRGHARAVDPTNGRTLDSTDNRSACYRCHPGSETRCLRGAMGSAVAADGTPAMQCQDCHGSMSIVGASSREGWLSEPTCQNCHTGTATQNSGAIRYSSAFGATGALRTAASSTFATTPNVPIAGTSLFRLSTGHGGLYCSACHGSTHAEYPSSHRNDNLQNLRLQGSAGVLGDCSVCHNSQPSTISGGPHGMHPVGQQWVNGHGDTAERSAAQCQACHGSDYRGTVLSRSLGDRTYSTKFGVKNFWRGFQVGCYACHRGPSSESANSNRPPVAVSATATATTAVPKPLTLQMSDADSNPLTTRIVTQPAHGTVALQGNQATYFPESGYAGPDSFTFAAWDGSVDSNLATVSLQVAKKFYIPFYQESATSYTGIAFTNNSTTTARLELTAYGADGRRLALPRNPAQVVLAAYGQSAKVASELFGALASQTGWIEVSSDNADVGCFFQFGGEGKIDGAAAADSLLTQFRLTRVHEGEGAFRGVGARTYLSVANPLEQQADVVLTLFGGTDGSAQLSRRTASIPAKGLLTGSVTDIFALNSPVTTGSVSVSTTGGGVVGFELVECPGSASLFGLGAAASSVGGPAYSAQLASGAGYFTSIKVLNASTGERKLVLRAVDDTGSELGSGVTVTLAPGHSLERDAAEMLSLPQGRPVSGSLVMESDGAGVVGDVVFGDPGSARFAAALPLQTKAVRQSIFGHVANGAGWFTGLALFNPNLVAATVSIDVYSPQGQKIGALAAPMALLPGRRISKLLTELVPAIAGQMGGTVVVSSTQPLISQELFGDSGMTLLSAVPPSILK